MIFYSPRDNEYYYGGSVCCYERGRHWGRRESIARKIQGRSTMLWFIVWHPIRLLFVVASHQRRGTSSSSQGTVTFTVGEEVYSLDLSSPSSHNVSKGDAFNGNADLHVTCSPEIMKKMIAKEVQPQQGE
jgi:hypothetical protein